MKCAQCGQDNPPHARGKSVVGDGIVTLLGAPLARTVRGADARAVASGLF